MHVYQARQQRHTGQIDSPCARRYRGIRGVGCTDRDDTTVGDGYFRMLDDSPGNHIDHAIGRHDDGPGVAGPGQQQGEGDKCAHMSS